MLKMIFDSHAHYDDEQFEQDRDELLLSMKERGIGYIVNIASSLSSTIQTIELANKYDFVYGTIGVHPSVVNELTEENFKELEKAANSPKIVAIGEIGLDYYWKDTLPGVQKIWLERQVELARKKKLPLVIHSRDASKDTLDMMKALKTENIGGVIHCFSYSKETAKVYLDMGFYLGIGGVITFNNAKKLKEVVEYMPLDRILIETDCPYLAPVPYRGKRNSSLYLSYIINEIASIKKIDADLVEEVTCQNAINMYKIKEL